jgi:hypothetical protein
VRLDTPPEARYSPARSASGRTVSFSSRNAKRAPDLPVRVYRDGTTMIYSTQSGNESFSMLSGLAFAGDVPASSAAEDLL